MEKEAARNNFDVLINEMEISNSETPIPVNEINLKVVKRINHSANAKI